MRRVRGSVFALVVVLASSRVAPLAAQERAVDAIADASSRESIRASLAQADAKGVPTAPLLTKVREGLAKQASAPRIAQAVAQLGQRLGVANDALAAATSADEVAAGAGALQAGVNATALRDLRTRWPSTPLTVPLGVMTQLVASGVPVTRAIAQVRLLLERGATASQLVAFTALVQADVAAGIAPDVAIMLRTNMNTGAGALTNSTGVGGATLPPTPPLTPAHPRP